MQEAGRQEALKKAGEARPATPISRRTCNRQTHKEHFDENQSRESGQGSPQLSRLDLDQDKLELFAGQVGDILEYMDKLGELDTDAVEPMYSPVSAHHCRCARTKSSKDYRREDVLANAPEQDGQYFIVPRII